MYSVLDNDTIEIVPYLPMPKRGFPSTLPLVESVNAILYKLKTGVQWHQLPTEVFFKEKTLSWESVIIIIENGASQESGRRAG